MRRASIPIQPPSTPHEDLAERLRGTAARLQSMPADVATSLSVTTSGEGRTEAAVRALASTIAAPLGFIPVVEAGGDAVTVIFRRSAADR